MDRAGWRFPSDWCGGLAAWANLEGVQNVARALRQLGPRFGVRLVDVQFIAGEVSVVNGWHTQRL